MIKVCDEALKETNRTLISLNEMLGYSSDSKPMLNKNNSSIIFSWLNKDGHPTSSSNTSKGTYCPSENLIALFASNDVRNYRDVLVDYWNSCQIVKYNASYSGCWNTNYRIEEFYFNRAEANIKQGEWELGMKDVNEVYSRRIEGGNGHLDAQNAKDAWIFFQEEKRREFCFEDIRWFDIRRWGLAVEHKYYDFSVDRNFITYVLDTNSPNYVLPLPLDVQRRNFEIEQPVRVESKTK